MKISPNYSRLLAVLIVIALLSIIVYCQIQSFNTLQGNQINFQATNSPSANLSIVKSNSGIGSNVNLTLGNQSGVLAPVVGSVTANHIPIFNANGNLIDGGSIPGGTGTVTSVSVVTANGVSAVVANPTTTPALTFSLGAIVPTSVNGLTISATPGTTATFPGVNSTLAALNIAQNWSQFQTFSLGASAPLSGSSEIWGASNTINLDVNNSVQSAMLANGGTMSMSQAVCIGTGANCQNNSYVDNNGLASGGVPYGGPDTCVGHAALCLGTNLGSFSVTGNAEAVSIGPSSRAMALATFCVGDKAECNADLTGGSGNEAGIGDAFRLSGNLEMGFFFGGHYTHNWVIVLGGSSALGQSGGNPADFADNQMLVGGTNQAAAGTNGITDVYFGDGDVAANSAWLSTKAHDVTFHITGNVGTDQPGKSTIWQGGSGTGAGTTGHLLFQTSTPTGTGTNIQGFTTHMDIGSNVTATNGARLVDSLNANGGIGFQFSNTGGSVSGFLSAFGSGGTIDTAYGANCNWNSGGNQVNTDGSNIGICVSLLTVSNNAIVNTFITGGGTASNIETLQNTGIVTVVSGGMYGMVSSATNSLASPDTALERLTAGQFAVNNGSTCGTVANCRDLTLRHLGTSGTAPTISAGFGTGAAFVGTAADAGGKIGVGTTPGTTGTITFGTAFNQAPACTVNDESTKLLLQATSSTSTLIIQGVFVNSDVISWVCVGR